MTSPDYDRLPRYTFDQAEALGLVTRAALRRQGLLPAAPAVAVVEWTSRGERKSALLHDATRTVDPARARAEAAAWAARLLDSDAVILDTETTGTDPATARVVQLGVLDMAGRVRLDTLVDPGVPIPPEAAAVHGITDRALAAAGAPSFAAVLPALTEAVRGRTVVVYNRDYDRPLLAAEIDRVHGAGAGEAWAAAQVGGWECAMNAWSRFVGRWNERTGDWQRFRLIGGDHTALGDCRATLALLRKMAEAAPR